MSLNQYIYQLPKICRSNLDWVIVGSQNAQSVEILIDEFNLNLTREEFRRLYLKATQDYGFMVINNNELLMGWNL